MPCEHYRKSLLRYLMIKTAGVRAGVKPGTLLRVARCCYLKDNTRSEKICIYQDEILAELKLEDKNDNFKDVWDGSDFFSFRYLSSILYFLYSEKSVSHRDAQHHKNPSCSPLNPAAAPAVQAGAAGGIPDMGACSVPGQFIVS